MNVSTDSLVDFVLDPDTYDDMTERNNPASLAAVNAATGNATDGHASATTVGETEQQAAVNTVANGAADGPSPAMGATAATADGATGRTASDTMAYVTMGVAPGDGDLLPPRFSGDRKTDAEEWLQDLLDYVEIRRVPKPTAAVLLRTRLTGVARKWLESIPAGTDFDEVVRRFRVRFGANDGTRTTWLNEFWNRRQAPDEPVGDYIEEMACLARRMRLDNEPLMRQGIIQGLRPDIKRDVLVQRPTTLEALAEAAAVGEANARAVHAESRAANTAVASQLAEMRTMMAALQDAITTGQRQHAGVNAIDAPAATAERPVIATPTTTAAATACVQSGIVTTATTPSTTTGVPHHIAIQLVMPDASASNQGTERGEHGGRAGRGRGRGWRGPWRGQLGTTTAPQQTQPPTFDATASAFQPRATWNNNGPPCQQCGRRHDNGNCRAANAVCFECGNGGHFARCCMYRVSPNAQHHP